MSLDFVTSLPMTAKGNTQIVVYVDRLTKMCHLAPLPPHATAIDVAQNHLDTVLKLHGLSRELVSDRDTKFTSQIWRDVMKLCGTTLSMSTAYHPESDGQTERMNQVIEDMLRHYISPNQDNWDMLLSLAEFAINNLVSSTTNNTPFRLNCGQDPLTPLSIVAQTKVPAAAAFVENMHKSLKMARLSMLRAQDRSLAAYDTRHRPHEFKKGDDVLLRTNNIHLQGNLTKKLLPKWAGPFKILRAIGAQAYELDLPPTMSVHPVFHTGLLKPWVVNPRAQPLPKPVIIDGQTKYLVETIIDHKFARRGKARTLSYLVKWVGYPPENNSWEPANALAGCATLDHYKGGRVLVDAENEHTVT